jgi:hypothetical protein
MKKVATVFAVIVLIIALLSVFGWVSIQVSKKNSDFDFLAEPIKTLYSFPDLFVASVEEVQTLGVPETFIKTSEGFQPVNKLEDDLIVLVSFSDSSNARSVALMNLKNDSTLHKWEFDNPISDHERIFHPMILPDKSLVFSYKGISLKRVDSLDNEIWNQGEVWPHHSKELDADGNIWICSYHRTWQSTGWFKIDGNPIYYKDERIAKVDVETGEVLFDKSVTQILIDNGLSNYLFKSSNLNDPIHTNDVQPALKTTEYYQKDDVFISCKQLSAILHYRPSTNKVIKVIEGPFFSQHDVDFLNDTSLVFFNNNYFPASNYNNGPAPKEGTETVFAGEKCSEIVRYDLPSGKFSLVADSVFRKNQIFTMTEGLIDFYGENTVFVEEQNSGILWVIKDDEVVYKNVLKSFHKGYHHLPNWTRVVRHPIAGI